MIAIDDVDFMDEQSFDLLRTLVEEEGILTVFSLSKDFKEPSVSASILYLKAHTHINLSTTTEDYCAVLICWMLSVKGVHRHIVYHIKREIKSDLRLLQTVCLSSAVTDYTILVPLNQYSEEELKNYYISDFDTDGISANQILILDIKPGIHDLEAMIIPSSMSDAVSEAINYLSVQDRLILKRAAVIGATFTQHSLESACPKFTTEQVEKSINNLMQKNILSVACTSFYMIDKIPPESPFKHVSCYNVCFCTKSTNKGVLRNYRVAYHCVGPYNYLRFRSKLFRSWLMDFMTSEQYENMHLEVANELESSGIFCVYCIRKKTTMVKMESALEEMSCAPIQTNPKLCFCAQIKARTYRRISLIFKNIGMKLFPVYYMKKAAQALNDINYPVQALNYAEIAEDTLPDYTTIIQIDTFIEDFNIATLTASVKRTQARVLSFIRRRNHKNHECFVPDTYSSKRISHCFESLSN